MISREAELFRAGKYEELWERCCSFIDLRLEDFMGIQRRLLLEQLELLKKCELGKLIMRGAKPKTLEEFREQVPLTTYNDYAPYLLKRKMDVLPRKPILWQCKPSGGGGCYRGIQRSAVTQATARMDRTRHQPWFGLDPQSVLPAV